MFVDLQQLGLLKFTFTEGQKNEAEFFNLCNSN